MAIAAVVTGAGSAAAQPAPAGTAPATAPPRYVEAFGVAVGMIDDGVDAEGEEVALVSAHGEGGKWILPTVAVIGEVDVHMRPFSPDGDADGNRAARHSGHLVAGARLAVLPPLTFAATAGIAATDYVIDTDCDLFGCRDDTEVVFGLVAGASARLVLVRRDGRWKDIGLEAHVSRAQYMDVGGVLTADVGLVFGGL